MVRSLLLPRLMDRGPRLGRSTAPLLAALMWALACGGGPAPAPAPAPVAPAPPGGEGPTGALEVDRRPTPDLMRRLASGEEDFARYVESERGVSFLEYYEDASGEDARAGEDGVVRVAERLCGEALSTRLRGLREDLARRVVDTGDDALFNCTEAGCFHPARGEYDLDGRFEFRDDPDGGLVLERVVRVEGGPVTEEFVEAAEAWVEQEVVRLAEEGCAADVAPVGAPPGETSSGDAAAGD